MICLYFGVNKCTILEVKTIYCPFGYHNAVFPALWFPNYPLLVDDLLACKLSWNSPYIPKVFSIICMPEIWADDDFRIRYENWFFFKWLQKYKYTTWWHQRHIIIFADFVFYFCLPEIIITLLAHRKIFLTSSQYLSSVECYGMSIS